MSPPNCNETLSPYLGMVTMSQREFQRVKVIENAAGRRLSVREASRLLQLSERQVPAGIILYRCLDPSSYLPSCSNHGSLARTGRPGGRPGTEADRPRGFEPIGRAPRLRAALLLTSKPHAAVRAQHLAVTLGPDSVFGFGLRILVLADEAAQEFREALPTGRLGRRVPSTLRPAGWRSASRTVGGT